MSKRSFVGVMVVALVLVLAAGGGLMASNMGFKLNKLLNGTSTSKSGQSFLALPYFRQTGLNKAGDLWNDIGGSTKLTSISRLVESSDLLQGYTGVSALNNFALTAGDGVLVKIKTTTDVNYIVVGSHDPAQAVVLDATQSGVSKSGQNLFAMPYHFTGTKAGDLWNDIGGSAKLTSIARLVNTTDLLQSYTGVSALNNFTLAPGDAYLIKVKGTGPAGNVNYIPSHY